MHDPARRARARDLDFVSMTRLHWSDTELDVDAGRAFPVTGLPHIYVPVIYRAVQAGTRYPWVHELECGRAQSRNQRGDGRAGRAELLPFAQRHDAVVVVGDVSDPQDRPEARLWSDRSRHFRLPGHRFVVPAAGRSVRG